MVSHTADRYVQVVANFEAIVTAAENTAYTAPQFNDRAPEVVSITSLDVTEMMEEDPKFCATVDALKKQVSVGAATAVTSLPSLLLLGLFVYAEPVRTLFGILQDDVL